MPSRPAPAPIGALLALATLLVIAAAPSSAAAAGAQHGSSSHVEGSASAHGWVWPLQGFRLTRPYVQPADRYSAGHRGIDLEPGSPGDVVRSPADGIVAFSGSVADRGILTIDHGDGYVTTLEPVDSELVAGSAVRGGDVVATLSLGGHADPGDLHFGVRLDGEYINPMLLFGGVPRAVLLPCC